MSVLIYKSTIYIPYSEKILSFAHQKEETMAYFVLDVGNSSVKAAFMEQGRIIRMSRVESVCDLPDDFIGSGEVSCGICSSVRPLSGVELHSLENLPFDVMQLSSDLPLPLKISYSTPSTLGPDRIAAAVGAWNRAPGRNILVIDAGTAITYDVVTSDGRYIGGNISPGAALRFRSLHEYTASLPRVSPEGDIPMVGYSTETAIRSGVINGVVNEISGYVNRLSTVYDSLLVFLTGGDADLFEIPIKSGIFAVKFLVLEGLECICRFNEKI